MADGEPDACIGLLDRVTAACCGHGDPGKAYATLDTGLTLQGRWALEWMKQPTWRPARPKGD